MRGKRRAGWGLEGLGACSRSREYGEGRQWNVADMALDGQKRQGEGGRGDVWDMRAWNLGGVEYTLIPRLSFVCFVYVCACTCASVSVSASACCMCIRCMHSYPLWMCVCILCGCVCICRQMENVQKAAEKEVQQGQVLVLPCSFPPSLLSLSLSVSLSVSVCLSVCVSLSRRLLRVISPRSEPEVHRHEHARLQLDEALESYSKGAKLDPEQQLFAGCVHLCVCLIRCSGRFVFLSCPVSSVCKAAILCTATSRPL